MDVSFGGIGEVVATFKTSGTVKKGNLVKLSANATVAACAADDRICGVAIYAAADGFASVQLKGAVTVTYSGTAPTVGYNKLLASAADKIAVDADGFDALVLSVDTTAKTAVIVM